MKKIFAILAVSFALFLQSCGEKHKEHKKCCKEEGNQTNIQNTDNQIDKNKKLVSDFYQEVFGDKNIASIDKYVADNYIQHNPAVADGKEALKTEATKWFQGAPKEKIDIKHIGADGNLVFIHLKSKMGDKTVSVIDIFKIENNKIVEHWDVIQEVPAKSANAHPMF